MKRSLVCAGIALWTAGSAVAAHAQGSAVMTHSSCAVALGAAGVAAPCRDGSAILFNPAAIASQPSVLGVGVSGITSSGSFTYDFSGEQVNRPEETTAVPFVYATYGLTDRLAAGIGVFAPYGLGLSWPERFEGRFAAYDSELRNIYIQPTVALQVLPGLSLGAGVDVVLASIEISQRADLADAPAGRNPVTGSPVTLGNAGIPRGTDFADVHLSGDGTAVTFHAGAHAELSENFSLGLRYLHRAKVDYQGNATFRQIPSRLTLPPHNPLQLPAGTPVDALVAREFTMGALIDQALSTSLTLPSQLVVGVALRPLPTLRLLADYQFTSWSDFDQARIDFAGSAPDSDLVLDYQDASTFRLGGEFAATSAFDLRAGFIYNTAAQREFSVSPLLAEAERNYYSVGFGYRVLPDLTIDAAYQLVDQSDRRGRVRSRPAGLSDAELRALNVGVYSSEANILSATLSYHFGGGR